MSSPPSSRSVAGRPSPTGPDARDTLDRLYGLLRTGRDVDGTLQALYRNLAHWRAGADTDTWKRLIAERLRPHPLCALLHQDPFTRRAFEKPRGYAGDAVLIDHLYGLAPRLPLDPVSRQIHRHVIGTRSARSVAHRRSRAAAWIDAVPVGGSVLAVAAGHAREAALSRRLAAGGLKSFVALDQDPASLAVIRQEYGHLGVEAECGSVRQIISGEFSAEDLDLVYATGLYDYLDQQAARRLTSALWTMLAPTGRLVIANFTPDTCDLGYIETYMDWWLVCRTEEHMRDLFSSLPEETIGELRVEAADGTDLLYATAQRAR